MLRASEYKVSERRRSSRRESERIAALPESGPSAAKRCDTSGPRSNANKAHANEPSAQTRRRTTLQRRCGARTSNNFAETARSSPQQLCRDGAGAKPTSRCSVGYKKEPPQTRLQTGITLFRPLERAHGAQTKNSGTANRQYRCFLLYIQSKISECFSLHKWYAESHVPCGCPAVQDTLHRAS